MKIRSLGRVDYETAWADMRAFTDARNKETEDELWIVEHPPVFTQGVAGKPENLLFKPLNIPVVKTDRGGQITYHGPGQAMLYVLFDLKRAGYGVRELVMRIENAVIAVIAAMAGYGVVAYGKRDAPGVYVSVAGSLSRSAGEGWGEGGGSSNRLRVNPAKQLPDDLKQFAREMRKQSTDAEALMWHLLRGRRFQNLKFRRQHAVGQYILDFYCDELPLAVELDRGQHQGQADYDATRTEILATRGIRVIRYWNNDVFTQTEGVLTDLFNIIEAMQSPSPPEPEGDKLVTSPALRERESEAKIASLGLKIRNGCTYHGVAFNVDMDLTPFSFINPCGFEGLRVTHLHELGVQAPLEAAGMALALELERQLGAPAK